MSERTLAFGPFELLPQRRLLLQNGQPVRLGSRALAILTRLVERPGQLVSKDDLMAAAWPGLFVEEVNIRVQMQQLRRALSGGDGAVIGTVPGRGYRFGAPVEDREREVSLPVAEASLPRFLGRVIGREDVTAAIVGALADRRLVTIVGPGGVGKTTVALAAARTLAEKGKNVCLVDLSPLTDPSLVATAIATALGIGPIDADVTAAVAACVQARRALLLLDNCEGLLESISECVETILSRAPEASVLATGRAPLRLEGERLHRLRPLSVPPEGAISAAEALGYSAVELFVERAKAVSDDFILMDQSAPLVGGICRSLDGLPLAIELAAVRTDHMGLDIIAGSLSDRFSLLTTGRRTAATRHRTLRATLDWSVERLSPIEHTVFRRLGSFAAGFDLDDAVIVAGELHSRLEVLEAVAELASNSLLEADISAEVTRYRMLETTRAYALDRLAAAGETSTAFERQCGRLCEQLGAPPLTWDGRLTPAWREHYARKLPDVRATLDWAFGPDGDPRRGIDLAVAAQPMWMVLRLVKEARDTSELALERLGGLGELGDRRETVLLDTITWSMVPLREYAARMDALMTRFAKQAETLELVEYQLRSHYRAYARATLVSDAARMASCVRAFGEVAERCGDPLAGLVHHRLQAYLAFQMGRPVVARDQAKEALASPILGDFGPYRGHYEVGHTLLARSLLSRALWTVGEVDDAIAEAEACVADAVATGNPTEIWYTLWIGPCTVAMLAGDRDRATRFVNLLCETDDGTAPELYRDWAERFRELLPRLGQATDDGPVVARPWRAPSRTHAELLAAIAPALAMAEIDDGTVSSFTPELLRGLGEQRLAAGSAVEADDYFRRSEVLAQDQGALSWELRTAISRGRLALRSTGAEDAARRLVSVLDRFTQGRNSLEFERGAQLVESLRK
ncbi:MAG TPA: winged helix-turn-helix domain-containing protein [Caulobacteraceae bacterium]